MSDMTGTSNNLRMARRLKDLTQAQLADLAGVDKATISDIERGKNKRPSWETVAMLSSALGVAAVDLFPVASPSALVVSTESSDAAR